MDQLVAEGVELRCGVDVGRRHLTVEELREQFDAVCAVDRLARAARPAGRRPRARRHPLRDGLPLRAHAPGARRRWRSRRDHAPRASMSSSSAVATPAPTASATPIARAPSRSPSSSCCPSRRNTAPTTARAWPLWPQKFRLSYAMEEARDDRQRRAGLLDRHDALRGQRTAWSAPALRAGRAAPPFAPVEGTEGVLEADLVLLAMGFLHPQHEGVRRRSAGREGPARQRPRADLRHERRGRLRRRATARRGQSLIVWAINEGRQCARMVDRFLVGRRPEAALVGGGDADEGPEGPPNQASPGL